MTWRIYRSRTFPTPFTKRLRCYARENRCTISAAVLTAVERELAMWEWREHIAQRPETDLGVDAATLIAEERNAPRKRRSGPGTRTIMRP